MNEVFMWPTLQGFMKSSSTICIILKKKEKISELDTAKGVMRVMKQQPRILDNECQKVASYLDK